MIAPGLCGSVACVNGAFPLDKVHRIEWTGLSKTFGDDLSAVSRPGRERSRTIGGTAVWTMVRSRLKHKKREGRERERG